jgi:hypothetical protein
MAFQSIGFHAALILNRLRNEQRINECSREDDERSRKRDQEEQQAREELATVNKRLADLSARVEPPGGRRGGN